MTSILSLELSKSSIKLLQLFFIVAEFPLRLNLPSKTLKEISDISPCTNFPLVIHFFHALDLVAVEKFARERESIDDAFIEQRVDVKILIKGITDYA